MSQTCEQKRFAISEVAADRHEIMLLQHIMRPSITCISKQLDPWSTAIRHTTAPCRMCTLSLFVCTSCCSVIFLVCCLVHAVADLNTVRFSAYRTSMKLRMLQKALHCELIVVAVLPSLRVLLSFCCCL